MGAVNFTPAKLHVLYDGPLFVVLYSVYPLSVLQYGLPLGVVKHHMVGGIALGVGGMSY